LLLSDILLILGAELDKLAGMKATVKGKVSGETSSPMSYTVQQGPFFMSRMACVTLKMALV